MTTIIKKVLQAILGDVLCHLLFAYWKIALAILGPLVVVILVGGRPDARANGEQEEDGL